MSNIKVGDRLLGARGNIFRVRSIKNGVVHIKSEESGLTWEISVKEVNNGGLTLIERGEQK